MLNPGEEQVNRRREKPKVGFRTLRRAKEWGFGCRRAADWLPRRAGGILYLHSTGAITKCGRGTTPFKPDRLAAAKLSEQCLAISTRTRCSSGYLTTSRLESNLAIRLGGRR